MDVAKELKVAINTGKVEIGCKMGLKTTNKKKAKLIVVSFNAPVDVLQKIKTAAGSEIPVYNYQGSSWELGGLCGKPFPVTTIAVIDPGESAILKVKEG